MPCPVSHTAASVGLSSLPIVDTLSPESSLVYLPVLQSAKWHAIVFKLDREKGDLTKQCDKIGQLWQLQTSDQDSNNLPVRQSRAYQQIKHIIQLLPGITNESYISHITLMNVLEWQHSEQCMCRLQNIAMCEYQESVTTGQTNQTIRIYHDFVQGQGNPPECQRFAVQDEAFRVVDVTNLWHEGGFLCPCIKP